MLCRPGLLSHVALSGCFLRHGNSSCQARRTSAAESTSILEQGEAQQRPPDCTSGTPVCHDYREQRATLTVAHNTVCCFCMSPAAPTASQPPHPPDCCGRHSAPPAAGAMMLRRMGEGRDAQHVCKDITGRHADGTGSHELVPGGGRMAAAPRLRGSRVSGATASCSRALRRQGIASGGSCVRCIRR